MVVLTKNGNTQKRGSENMSSKMVFWYENESCSASDFQRFGILFGLFGVGDVKNILVTKWDYK